jgi:hypothetical protein
MLGREEVMENDDEPSWLVVQCEDSFDDENFADRLMIGFVYFGDVSSGRNDTQHYWRLADFWIFGKMIPLLAMQK